MTDAHYEILSTLFWILLYLGTSIWVFFDARKIKRVTGSEKINPVFWLVGCLALWIVAFPIYVWNRRGFNK